MTKYRVRHAAVGAALCITAGLLSLPVVAQSTGRGARGATGLAAAFEGTLIVQGADPSVGRVFKIGDSERGVDRAAIRRQLFGDAGSPAVDFAEKMRVDQLPQRLLEEKLRDGRTAPPPPKDDSEETAAPVFGVTPPPNDDCATPTVVGLGSTPFTNVCATQQPSDPTNFPCVSGATLNTIWFEFTAPSSGLTVVDTCTGTNYDSTLGVFTGPACGPYAQIGCNDDACGFQSRVSFTATAGTTYRILVEGFGGATGSGNLTISQPTPPANDECANATVLPSAGPFPITGTQDTSLASTNPSDPLQACTVGGAAQNSNSVWFRWTPSQNCEAFLETCTSGYDTVVSVFTGPCTGLTEIACNDDGGSPNCSGTLQSGVCWQAVAGTTYTIEVTDFGAPGGGTLNFSLDCTQTSTCPTPGADECTSPQVIPSNGPFPLTCRVTTNTATTSPSDPLQACTVGGPAQNSNSVWFSWTAPNDCNVILDTCGSNYDTVLSVFTGTCGNLNEIACNDDGGSPNCSGTLQSGVTFTAFQGQTYLIEVTDFGAPGGGNLVKNMDCQAIGPCVPPSCDAPATNVSGWSVSLGCLTQSSPTGGACGLPEAEVYVFGPDSNPSGPDDADLTIVDKIKVPACGLRSGISVDYFFVRANPLCSPGAPTTGEDICLPIQPARRPRVILNDVFYPGIMFPPSATGQPYEAVVAFTFNSARATFGLGSFDWFKVVEFDPTLCPDLDGDGDLDCGIQFSSETGAGITMNLTPSTDNYGAEVIEFLVNRGRHNLSCLNVFEEHPPAPVTSVHFPGAHNGEDSHTRPWAFDIQ